MRLASVLILTTIVRIRLASLGDNILCICFTSPTPAHDMLIQMPYIAIMPCLLCFYLYMHIRIASHKSDAYVFITLDLWPHVGPSGKKWDVVGHYIIRIYVF